MVSKWDKRFLELAEYISAWSKDPSTKVGAVIANKKEIVSLGFNGFPKKIKDLKSRYKNRDLKYKLTIHAEINAMEYANKNLTNYTLYTWPFIPCSRCCVQIIQAGISRVVSVKPSKDVLSRWAEDLKLTRKLFKEAKVKLIEYKG